MFWVRWFNSLFRRMRLKNKKMFIHTHQPFVRIFMLKKYLFFAELAISQRWSAIFCATGVWGVKPIGRVRMRNIYRNSKALRFNFSCGSVQGKIAKSEFTKTRHFWSLSTTTIQMDTIELVVYFKNFQEAIVSCQFWTKKLSAFFTFLSSCSILFFKSASWCRTKSVSFWINSVFCLWRASNLFIC